MKKIIVVFVTVFALSFSCMAAFQFEYSSNGTTENVLGLNNFTLKILEGTGVISAAFQSGFSMGWYDINDGFTGLTNQAVLDNDTGRYILGEFSAGDEVGIWMNITDSMGREWTVTSSGDAIGTIDKWGDFDGNIERTAQYYNDVIHGRLSVGWMDVDDQKYWGYYYTNGFTLKGTESESPSGQPLPGILATLLLGGGMLGLFRKKKL